MWIVLRSRCPYKSFVKDLLTDSRLQRYKTVNIDKWTFLVLKRYIMRTFRFLTSFTFCSYYKYDITNITEKLLNKDKTIENKRVVSLSKVVNRFQVIYKKLDHFDHRWLTFINISRHYSLPWVSKCKGFRTFDTVNRMYRPPHSNVYLYSND